MHDNLAYWWYKNYASESMHKISVYILKWDEFQVKLSMREKKKKTSGTGRNTSALGEFENT